VTLTNYSIKRDLAILTFFHISALCYIAIFILASRAVCHFALDYFVVLKFVESGLKLFVFDFSGYFAVETLQKDICHVRGCTEDDRECRSKSKGRRELFGFVCLRCSCKPWGVTLHICGK